MRIRVDALLWSQAARFLTRKLSWAPLWKMSCQFSTPPCIHPLAAPPIRRWNLFLHPLGLGSPCYLLWLIECDTSDSVPGPSLGLKRLCVFFTLSQTPASAMKIRLGCTAGVWQATQSRAQATSAEATTHLSDNWPQIHESAPLRWAKHCPG